jgi:penicillin G amidase
MRARFWPVVLLLACDPAPAVPTDTGPMDAGPIDAAVPTRIEDLPIERELDLQGLSAPVEVIRDTRGFPHVYGATPEDVMRAEGFLVAEDRFPQMELLRRSVLGTLAAGVGNLAPESIESDRNARIHGYGRLGAAAYASIPATDETRRALDAFTDGVNQYIDALGDGRAELPRGTELINLFLSSATLDPWEPSDVLAIARFQASSLHEYSRYEIERTRAWELSRTVFSSTAADPRHAARVGAFTDLAGFAPSLATFTIDGFPDTSSTLLPGGRPIRPLRPNAVDVPLPSVAQLDRALAFFERDDMSRQWFGEQRPGSNDWVVDAGDHALLANDPHLSLLSPPLWWMAHLDTERAGGDLGVMGVTLAGLPGVILGFTDQLAWGATVTTFDVTDEYFETITPGTAGGPDTVLFDGAQVPIETIHEIIQVAGSPDVDVAIEVVPHHGIILPDTREAGSAISVRWAATEPSNELRTFLGFMRAQSVEDGFAALEHMEALTLNWVLADSGGHIGWSTSSRVPTRDPRACTFVLNTDGTIEGISPDFVLPGTGEYEWTGELTSDELPHALDPASGYLATANADPVGVTADGNPCNDAFYLGGGEYVPGERVHRISERLDAVLARGTPTATDMMDIQAATRSSLGEVMRDGLVGSLDRALEEAATPGAHPDLAAALTGVSPAQIDALEDLRARLASWTLETPHGVGATDATVIGDSIATTLFSVLVTRLAPLALADEANLLDTELSSYGVARFLHRAYSAPETLATYDDVLSDSVLWDDLETAAVAETRDDRVVRAALAALTFLGDRLGADRAAWRWGQLHRAVFPSIVPGMDTLTIPSPTDPEFAGGFPRGGDWEAVDVANFSLWNTTSFDYSEGPSMRFVVDMSADGPVAYNVLPGGELIDPASPHHADEAAHWHVNEAPQLWFREADVVLHAESRTRFLP